MSNHKSRIAKLESQQPAAPYAAPEVIAERAARCAEIFSSPENVAAVKRDAAQWPDRDNMRLLRIVELLEGAAGRVTA